MILALSAALYMLTAGALGLLAVRSSPPSLPPAAPDIRAEWLAEVTFQRVIVHTHDDRSIEGMLASAGPTDLVLVHAKLLGSSPTDLGGRVWLPRSSVFFVQSTSTP